MQRSAAPYPSWIILLALVTSSCIIDSDQPCDRGRIELHGAFSGCVCAPGHVPDPDNKGCSPCRGAFEEASNGSCQCLAGYARSKGVCSPIEDGGAGTADAAADAASTGAPSGLGMACTAQGDCAGFDADFCTPFPPRSCVVRNCATGENVCPSGLVCCDVSGANAIFPDLSMAKGICSTTASCAMGGTVVMP